MFGKLKDFIPKIEKAKYIIVAPVTRPNATLQTSIFHQNVGEITPLKFVQEQHKIKINTVVDTSYNNERGPIYIPQTNDYYIGEGSIEE